MNHQANDDDLCTYRECLSPDKEECEKLKNSTCGCSCHEEYSDAVVSDQDWEEQIAELKNAASETGALVRIYALHPPESEKLEGIKKEMKEVYGAPTLRVVHVGEEIFALEGSHRLAAARDLGFKPRLLSLALTAPIPADLAVLTAEGVDINLTMVDDVLPFLKTEAPYDFAEPVEGAHKEHSYNEI